MANIPPIMGIMVFVDVIQILKYNRQIVQREKMALQQIVSMSLFDVRKLVNYKLDKGC